MLSPASVLPEPGTPVTKQIDLFPVLRDSEMIVSYRLGSFGEVLCSSFASGDLRDIMALVKRLGSLNDCRCRTIDGIQPRSEVNFWSGSSRDGFTKYVSEVLAVGAYRAEEPVGKLLKHQRAGRGIRGEQKGNYELVMALLVKVLEIKCVVEHLIKRMSRIVGLSNLEFDNDNNS